MKVFMFSSVLVFCHDASYSDGKYLRKRTISDKILKDTDYEIAINCAWWLPKTSSKYAL